LSIDAVTGQPASNQNQKEFNWAIRSDYGMNYQFLSRQVAPPGTGNAGEAYPVLGSQIAQSASTILACDTVWARSTSGGPNGGGSRSCDPPCFRDPDGNWAGFFPAFCFSQGCTFWYHGGWDPFNTGGTTGGMT